MSLPSSMKALVRREGTFGPAAPPSSMLELVSRPLPTLRKGDLLVRMEAASCNPSDMLSIRGGYSFQRAPGEVCGIEGCGTVVAANAGLLGAALKGRRVAVGNQGGDGVWAEYARIEAKYAIPIGTALPQAASAAFIVNPFSSFALVHRARALGSTVVVQNAGASQVGRGVSALARKLGLRAISLVRKEAQAEEIRASGSEALVQDGARDYVRALQAKLGSEKRAAFFDAVGGPASADIMTTLPRGSTTIVFGFLGDESENPRGFFPARELVFGEQRIESYWLTPWFASIGPVGALRAAMSVKSLFAEGVFSTRVATSSDIAGYLAALDAYERDPAAGKALLSFASAS